MFCRPVKRAGDGPITARVNVTYETGTVVAFDFNIAEQDRVDNVILHLNQVCEYCQHRITFALSVRACAQVIFNGAPRGTVLPSGAPGVVPLGIVLSLV
jgi:hypothetical protein